MGTKDFVRLLAGMLRKTYDMSHSTLTEKNLKILAKLPFIPSQIHLTEVKDLIKTVLNRLKKSTEVDENGKRTLAELSEKIKVSWKEAFNKAAEEAKKLAAVLYKKLSSGFKSQQSVTQSGGTMRKRKATKTKNH